MYPSYIFYVLILLGIIYCVMTPKREPYCAKCGLKSTGECNCH